MRDTRSLRRRARTFTKALRVVVRAGFDYAHTDAFLRRDPLHRVTFEVDE